MNALMSLQSTLLSKGLMTHITEIRVLPTMYTLVHSQSTRNSESFTTEVTTISMLFTVHRKMFLEVTQINERPAAHITRKFLPHTVFLQTSPQISLVIKWLSTNITGIQTFFMYALMTPQCSQQNKWFIAYITSARMLLSMYSLPFIHSMLSTEEIHIIKLIISEITGTR